MKLNIFEGARRISMLIGALWVIWVCADRFSATPDPYVAYAVLLPDSTPSVTDDCPSDSAIEYLKRKAADGKTINIKLCFFSVKNDSGEMFVPYANAANGKVWMGGVYSTEVQQYTTSVANKFGVTPEGIAAFESISRKALLEHWKDAAMLLFGGLAVGWAVVAAIGWIVRGFMGIPKGQDMRAPT